MPFQSYPEVTWDAVGAVFVLIAIVGALLGYLTDLVLGDRGFGALGNGLLTVLGATLALYAQFSLVSGLTASDVATSVMIAAGSSTGLLLALGLAKSLIDKLS